MPDRPLTIEDIMEALPWRGHEDHLWEQVGRCVYCVDCELRLYQGRIPLDHTKAIERPARWTDTKATNAMRNRWGMDER